MKFSYRVEGMHCSACVEKIKNVLSPHFKKVILTLHPPLLQIEAEQEPTLSDLNHFISTLGAYTIHADSSSTANHQIKKGLRSYYPLFLIATYLVGVSLINNIHDHTIHWQNFMNQFMAGFFLVFSAFKFLDLRGFANGYASYDLLAKRWNAYGTIYPFIELSLGILYLTQLLPTMTQIITIVVMGFSSLGVINSLLKKQSIQCACLGTIINVPLSTVTLIEDLTMVILAIIGLRM